MAQADSHPTTRRSVIGVAASVVAAAVFLNGSALAAAPPALPNCTYPDHARKFAAIYERWLNRFTRDERNSERFNARILELTGVSREEWVGAVDDHGDEFSATWDRVFEEIHGDDPLDEHGSSIEWNEIHDIMYPLCREIAELPINTLADLALRSRAMALSNHSRWTGDEDDDEVVVFVEAVAKFAGVETMPGFGEVE
jgi:hypothetical protein